MSRYRIKTLTFIKEQQKQNMNAVDALLKYMIRNEDDIKIIKDYGINYFHDDKFLEHCNPNFRKFYLPSFFRSALSNSDVVFAEAEALLDTPENIDRMIQDTLDGITTTIKDMGSKALVRMEAIALEIIEYRLKNKVEIEIRRKKKKSNNENRDDQKLIDYKLEFLSKKDGLIKLMRDEYSFLESANKLILYEQLEKLRQTIKNFQVKEST